MYIRMYCVSTGCTRTYVHILPMYVRMYRNEQFVHKYSTTSVRKWSRVSLHKVYYKTCTCACTVHMICIHNMQSKVSGYRMYNVSTYYTVMCSSNR